MKSALSKRPSAFALDVIGLGTKVVTPASSQALSFWATEVASVGEGLQALAPHGLVGGTRNVVQLCSVIADVRDLVRKVQVVPGIDSVCTL